jgi:hypothetical protein
MTGSYAETRHPEYDSPSYSTTLLKGEIFTVLAHQDMTTKHVAGEPVFETGGKATGSLTLLTANDMDNELVRALLQAYNSDKACTNAHLDRTRGERVSWAHLCGKDERGNPLPGIKDEDEEPDIDASPSL